MNPFSKKVGSSFGNLLISSRRNWESGMCIGDANLSYAPYAYKDLIGRSFLVSMTGCSGYRIMDFLRATREYDYFEVCIDGEKIWIKSYPTGVHCDFGFESTYIKVCKIHKEEDLISEKISLE